MRHWADLQKREKLVVLLGGGILLIFFSYVLLIAPLRKDLVQLKAGVLSKKADLVWMQAAASKVRQLSASSSNNPSVSPLKMIDQSARHYGINSSLKRVNPGEDGKIKVWFESLVYTDFMQFLRGIGGKGLVVASLTVERLEVPGVVNARVTFKTGLK